MIDIRGNKLDVIDEGIVKLSKLPSYSINRSLTLFITKQKRAEICLFPNKQELNSDYSQIIYQTMV